MITHIHAELRLLFLYSTVERLERPSFDLLPPPSLFFAEDSTHFARRGPDVLAMGVGLAGVYIIQHGIMSYERTPWSFVIPSSNPSERNGNLLFKVVNKFFFFFSSPAVTVKPVFSEWDGWNVGKQAVTAYSHPRNCT